MIALLLLFLAALATARDTVVLMAGEIRTFALSANSIKTHLLAPYDSDLALCIWDSTNVTPVNVSILLKKENIRPIFITHFGAKDVDAYESRFSTDAVHWRDCHDAIIVNKSTKVAAPAVLQTNIQQYPPGRIKPQFYGWARCLEKLGEYERAQGAAYKWVVRHRFDMALWDDYPPKALFNRSDVFYGFPHSFVDPPGNVNDRIWVTSRALAEIPFNTLTFAYYWLNVVELLLRRGATEALNASLVHVLGAISGPAETYLGVHLRAHGVPIVRMPVFGVFIE